MKFKHVALTSLLTFGSLPLMAGTADLTIDAFAEASSTDIIGGGVEFRFTALAGEATANEASHVLIEGLQPLAADGSAFASTYTAVNLSSGATQDVGMVYLQLPESAALPAGVAASPIVGIVARGGSWESVAPVFNASTVGGSTGSIDFDVAAGTLAFSTTRDGATFTGSTTYTFTDAEAIELAALSLSGNGQTFNFGPTTMLRDGSRYYGVLESTDMVDFDSLLFDVELPAVPDADADGLPDLVDSDVVIAPGNGLTVLEDAWSPNADTIGWLYGEPGLADTIAISTQFGYIYHAGFPWIFDYEWGWVFFLQRRGETGPVDFYSPTLGFLTIFEEANTGWFYSWSLDQYDNFVEPRGLIER